MQKSLVRLNEDVNNFLWAAKQGSGAGCVWVSFLISSIRAHGARVLCSVRCTGRDEGTLLISKQQYTAGQSLWGYHPVHVFLISYLVFCHGLLPLLCCLSHTLLILPVGTASTSLKHPDGFHGNSVSTHFKARTYCFQQQSQAHLPGPYFRSSLGLAALRG